MSRNNLTKSQIKALRNESRKNVPQLLKDSGNRCHWCKEEIVVRRMVKQEKIVQECHGLVSFWDEQHRFKIVKLASTDHLVRVVDGGDNSRTNTVPSCWFCNNARSNSSEAIETKRAQC